MLPEPRARRGGAASRVFLPRGQIRESSVPGAAGNEEKPPDRSVVPAGLRIPNHERFPRNSSRSLRESRGAELVPAPRAAFIQCWGNGFAHVGVSIIPPKNPGCWGYPSFHRKNLGYREYPAFPEKIQIFQGIITVTGLWLQGISIIPPQKSRLQEQPEALGLQSPKFQNSSPTFARGLRDNPGILILWGQIQPRFFVEVPG